MLNLPTVRCRLQAVLQAQQVHHPVDKCERMGRIPGHIKIDAMVFNKISLHSTAALEESPLMASVPHRMMTLGEGVAL